MRAQAKTKSPKNSPEPEPDPSSTARSRQFDWNTVRCRLLWYYKGAPSTWSGTFTTVNVIVCHLLRGALTVERPGLRMRATAGDWMVMLHTLGKRYQKFAPGSQVESLHLSVDAGAAEWAGSAILVMRGDKPLRAAIAKVGRYIIARHPSGLMPAGPVYTNRTFEERIHLQALVWSFMDALYPHLQEGGIHLCGPEQYDARISASMTFINNWPLKRPWDRKQIGRATGVSASQLDRIWRKARGQTPFQYWDAHRVLVACDQLENSQASIKEIADNLGFTHLPQFSTWFRRHHNISPRDYRRIYLEGR
jgi:AraC-like DNA-binding protein